MDNITKRPQLESVNACPLCGKKHSTHWAIGRDLLHQITDFKFEYVSCSSCQLVYIKQRYSSAEVSSLYPEEYDPYKSGIAAKANTFPASLEAYCKDSTKHFKTYKNIAKPLTKIWPDKVGPALSHILSNPTGTLLDFGCGSDAYLNKAREFGWQTIGMDFSEQAISSVIASNHRGIVLRDPADWDSIPDKSLEYVRLNHVIEHLYAPLETLAKIKNKLKPNGKIYLSTPNVDGFSARTFKTFWRGLECPRHIILYSPHTLKMLLDWAGFKEITILHEDNPKDYIRSKAYRDLNSQSLSSSLIEALPQRKNLYQKYFLISKLSALAKHGDRIHAFASTT